MFIIIKEAIYRHELIGCFSSFDRAKLAAKEAVLAERDDHHHFTILQVEVNQVYKLVLTKRVGEEYGERVVMEVYRSRKKGEVVVDYRRAVTDVVEEYEPKLQFVYDVLNDDPVALDVLSDVVMRGG